MKQLNNIAALRTFITAQRHAGKTIAFVPTMGALHDGHLALVKEGQRRADICLPYIFLNPTQFAEGEDLDSYPNTLDSDLKKLSTIHCDVVYTPQKSEIYPDNFNTSVSVGDITDVLEGEHRPHFFGGVTTIVCKMLMQCLPDIALFGEKDYQQLLTIQKMVQDLNIPVEIIGIPTVRDENGLALSSRNQYLNDEGYHIAIEMNKILAKMATRINNGDTVEDVEQWAKGALITAGFTKIDYCTIRDAKTLKQAVAGQDTRILAAAWINQTRLIDNIPCASSVIELQPNKGDTSHVT